MATATSASASDPTLLDRHLPGLDGLRGVAVLAVLAYHLWPSLVPGGFLGVNVFFVLSGFLITRLMLAEHAATSTVALGAFWARRGRRLLPASMITLAAVAVIWSVHGWLTRAFSLDIIWSLADLANWHTLLSGSTYGASGLDSPVLHFWSLAIEEQCYLVLPLVVWFVLSWRGWSTRVLTRIVTAMLMASLLYTAANRADANLVYLSTFSRAAELLSGVLLALIVVRRGAMPSGRAWRVAGPIAALTLLLATVTTSLDNPVYASGGLFVAALLGMVVLIASTGGGRLARALAIHPLRYVGRVSYAVYLFHWPILMGFREARVDGWWVKPAILIATFGLAALSMVLIEGPIRNRRRAIVAARPLILATGASIVAVSLVGVAPASADPDFVAAQAQMTAMNNGSQPFTRQKVASHDAAPSRPVAASSGAPTAPTDLAPSRAQSPTVLVFGDSTALMLGLGLGYTDVAVEVPGMSNVGCPMSRGGSYRSTFDESMGGNVLVVGKACDWTTRLPALAARSQPQIALFSGGMIDTVPRRLPALGRGWHTLDEPAYQRLLRSEYDVAIDGVVAASPATKVVLLTMAADWKRADAANRARVAILNQVLAQAVSDRPAVTRLVDLAGWIDASGERQRLCPDGLHLVPQTTAKEVYERFLGPELQRIASGEESAPNPYARATTAAVAGSPASH